MLRLQLQCSTSALRTGHCPQPSLHRRRRNPTLWLPPNSPAPAPLVSPQQRRPSTTATMLTEGHSTACPYSRLTHACSMQQAQLLSQATHAANSECW